MTDDIDQSLLPTDSEVAEFQARGWYVTRQVFSDSEIDAAMASVERFYDGVVDNPLDLGLSARLDWKKGDSPSIRINNYIALKVRALGALALKPVVGAIAARLIGAEHVRLWNSSLLYKECRASETDNVVGWHADAAYWQTSSSERMLTGWVPLQATTKAMGTLEVFDGSNQWSRDPRIAGFFRDRSAFGHPERFDDVARCLGRPLERIALELQSGQMSFHHRLTVHGSGPNTSDTPRIAIMAGYQASENGYRPAFDEDGTPYHHESDSVCRKTADGLPDYADPAFFPAVA